MASSVFFLSERESNSSGLSFTSSALRRSVTNPSEELSTSFNSAYDGTLKKYHSFVVRPVFSVTPLPVYLVLIVARDESVSLSSGLLQETGTRSDESGKANDRMVRRVGEGCGRYEDCVCQ